jgi:sulfate adenylyltransferase subunit 2
MIKYHLNHLRELEAEAIYVIRETAAQFERPAMLFSGGKDSIVMTHLARKAFYPARIPFPLLHVDTGHNFPETLVFRDKMVDEIGARLEVRYVQDSIDKGRAREEKGPNASRNVLQTVTLLDALEELKLMLPWEVQEEMRRRQELKNDSFLTVMNSVNGTQKINGLNYGCY